MVLNTRRLKKSCIKCILSINIIAMLMRDEIWNQWCQLSSAFWHVCTLSCDFAKHNGKNNGDISRISSYWTLEKTEARLTIWREITQSGGKMIARYWSGGSHKQMDMTQKRRPSNTVGGKCIIKNVGFWKCLRSNKASSISLSSVKQVHSDDNLKLSIWDGAKTCTFSESILEYYRYCDRYDTTLDFGN